MTNVDDSMVFAFEKNMFLIFLFSGKSEDPTCNKLSVLKFMRDVLVFLWAVPSLGFVIWG